MRKEDKGKISALVKLTRKTFNAYACGAIKGTLVYSNRAKCRVVKISRSTILTVIKGEQNEFAIDGGVNLTRTDDHNYKYIRISVVYQNEEEAANSKLAPYHVGRALSIQPKIQVDVEDNAPKDDTLLVIAGHLLAAARHLQQAADVIGNPYAGWHNPGIDLFNNAQKA